MKEKGFTLIELLSVIVILALIALIATPIIMNFVEEGKRGAAERSVDNYIDAVETAVAKARIDGIILEGEYTILENGNLCPVDIDCEAEPNKIIKIDMSGNKPSSGTIIIENGLVVDKLSTDEEKKTTMVLGDYDIKYNPEREVYVATKIGENSGNKPETLCRPADELTSVKIFDGQKGTHIDATVGLLAKDVENDFDYGVTYICNLGDGVERTFFVLEDGDNNGDLIKTTEVLVSNENSGRASTGEVALIMDSNHNNDTMSWCSDTSTVPYCNFAHINSKLTSIRQSWTKLNSSQVNLPTYAQIFAVNGSDSLTNSPWLFANNISSSGYWISHMNNGKYEGYYAYVVYFSGSTFGMEMVSQAFGVRPVVTLPKTELGL